MSSVGYALQHVQQARSDNLLCMIWYYHSGLPGVGGVVTILFS